MSAIAFAQALTSASVRGLSEKSFPTVASVDTIRSPASLRRALEAVGGLTVIAFRDNHLVYALTWYALALMIIGRTWQITRKTRRNLAE